MPGTVLHGDSIGYECHIPAFTELALSYKRTDIKQVEYVCEVMMKPNKGDTESWGGEMYRKACIERLLDRPLGEFEEPWADGTGLIG